MPFLHDAGWPAPRPIYNKAYTRKACTSDKLKRGKTLNGCGAIAFYRRLITKSFIVTR